MYVGVSLGSEEVSGQTSHVDANLQTYEGSLEDLRSAEGRSAAEVLLTWPPQGALVAASKHA